jgi:UDP-N-acetylmuramoyl-tripeptide--D-alanyl-D-alanine ligase
MAVQLLFLLFLLPFTFVRWVRWLAIVQQKEYRLDRLLSFLRTREGIGDALRMLPRSQEFTRTGMKRPVRTIRALLVGLISIFICGSLLAWGWLAGWPSLALLMIYILLPVILLLSCVPTAFVASVMTWLTLWQAQQKIRRAAPIIIGVGGSYGKTSTKHLLHHILSQKYSAFVTPKSHNTKYSVAKSIVNGFSDQKIALLEYGAYTRGEIKYLTQWFPPQYAVETGFTLQHLGIFGSQQNSILAESELIAALSSSGIAFCNGDDPGAAKICELGRIENQVKVINYSGPESTVQLNEVELNQMGQLAFRWQKQRIQTKLVGRHYLINAQAAITVAQVLGLSETEITRGFESFVPNSSFISSFKNSKQVKVINDGGTSNPKGFEAAIKLMNEIDSNYDLLITGGIVDLGDESSSVHKQLAEMADTAFDQVIYLGRDGKGEFEAVFKDKMITQDSEIRQLLANLKPESAVLIEGRVPAWIEKELQ